MSARDVPEPLDHHEQKEVRERSSPGGKIVYEAVMKEAAEELSRSSSALFWSGLAAGMGMGFSLLAEATLRDALPETTWSTLLSKLGYSFGFLIVILGRQQLFTENTLTPILPLMRHKDGKTLENVVRLWGVVLLANLVGALVVAWLIARTPLLSPGVHDAAISLGREAMSPAFGTVFVRAIFAGWLVALLVWMLPYAESAHFFVIVALTWLIGALHLSHVIAGAVSVFAAAWNGDSGWSDAFTRFMIPALLGNIVGGVLLVAGLNHAQVVAGHDTAKKDDVEEHRSARVGENLK